MKTKTFDPVQVNEIIQKWTRTLDQLLQDVSGWVQDLPGWLAHPVLQKEVSEEVLGTYMASVLTVDTPQGRVILEPMARMVFGGRGTVEIYAWPTLYRV